MPTIEITPWPAYLEGSCTPIWEVRVAAPKFRGTLRWSAALGRFVKDNHTFRLRRGSPAVYHLAVDLMRDFCSKSKQSTQMGA